MRPADEGGSRFGFVLNGSPLFTGGAGSGESEIRRHVLENDLLEAIVGLPTDMSYNTGIATYVWIVSNRKPAAAGSATGLPLRDTENVPLGEDIDAYFKREVLPHAPDAWIDHDKTKTGYEIPFNRHFYVFKPLRPLAEIDAELKVVTDRIVAMIGGLTA
jgi:type I restriction-modification system DNA methylase subunit